MARGWLVAQVLGRSPDLVDNFPVIDRFENGVATSIKSVNPFAGNEGDPQAWVARIRGYIRELSNWQGQQTPWGSVRIAPGDILERIMELAVPSRLQPAQMRALQQLQQYAGQQNPSVQLKIYTIMDGEIWILPRR